MVQVPAASAFSQNSSEMVILLPLQFEKSGLVYKFSEVRKHIFIFVTPLLLPSDKDEHLINNHLLNGWMNDFTHAFSSPLFYSSHFTLFLYCPWHHLRLPTMLAFPRWTAPDLLTTCDVSLSSELPKAPSTDYMSASFPSLILFLPTHMHIWEHTH